MKSNTDIRSEEEELLLSLFNNYLEKSVIAAPHADEPAGIVALPGAGSSRRYYRIRSGEFCCVGVAGDNLRENESFCRLTEAFGGFPVPSLLAVDPLFRCYIVEDLGSTDLFSLLGTPECEALVGESLRTLARMQCVPESKWRDAAMCAPFCRRQAMWDLNYFKYEFARPSGIEFDEDALEDDFEQLAARLVEASESCGGFMYRDFQSRNVMVKDGRPRFIDYQGGRRGPVLYDAVSFLWQAKANFSADFRKRNLAVYAGEYCRLRAISPDELLRPLDIFILFRMLQVLGAYGFRGLVERKAHFIESIPFALKSLGELSAQGVIDDYPELHRLCDALCSQPKWQKKESKSLTVTVFSFSYKKGYPDDLSGNGGGFMFDCRWMHNPGRYAEYKQLTGLDKPVRDFLEKRGEIQGFVADALRMVVPAVDRYNSRGFTGLQIGFGCTGGQHRSVYAAQAVAEELSRRFADIHIELIHRERGIRREFGPEAPGDDVCV